jgi:hypothetical protein
VVTGIAHTAYLLGNTVATIVMSKWEGALDQSTMQRVLDRKG